MTTIFDGSTGEYSLQLTAAHASALAPGETPYPEFSHGTVEYLVSSDPRYLPASVDASCVQPGATCPADTTHVQANVLAVEAVRDATILADAATNRITDFSGLAARFEGVDLSIPTAERQAVRRIPVPDAEGALESVNADVQAAEIVLPYYALVLLPATASAIYSGVLSYAISALLEFLRTQDACGTATCANRAVVVPVFFNEGVTVFRRVGGDIARLEELTLLTDPFATEPVMPCPLAELQLDRGQLDAERGFFDRVLAALYDRLARARTAQEPGPFQGSCFGACLAGAVSTLQKTGGKVVALVCDRPSRSLGALPEAPAVAAAPQSAQGHDSAFSMADSSVAALLTNKKGYSRDVFYNRLANEAASHNVGVDIIALPSYRGHLGLFPLSALPIMTSGSLLYNDAALGIDPAGTPVSLNGNKEFAYRALLRILTRAQGISGTLSVRASESLSVRMTEAGAEPLGPVAAESAGMLCTARNFLLTKLSTATRSDRPVALTATASVTKPRYKCAAGDAFYGNYQKVSEVEYALAACDEDKAYAIELRYTGKIPAANRAAYVQTAFLYTAPDGSRRIRVSTLPLAVGDSMADVYNGCAQQALVGYVAKRLAFAALNSAPLVSLCPDAFGGRILACSRPLATKQLLSRIEAAESFLDASQTPTGSADALASQQVIAQSRTSVGETFQTGHASEVSVGYYVQKYQRMLGTGPTVTDACALSTLADADYALRAVADNYKGLEFLVPMLGEFRRICSSAEAGRMIVPQAVQLLPLYAHGLARTAVLQACRTTTEGGGFTADRRAAQAFALVSGDSACVMGMLYPTIIDVVKYLTVALPGEQAVLQGRPDLRRELPVVLPIPERANSRFLPSVGRSVLLLVNGTHSLLWVGSFIDADMRQCLFGAREHAAVRAGVLSSEFSAPPGGDDASWRATFDAFIRLVRFTEQLHNCVSSTIVVPEGDTELDGLARSLIIEDPTSSCMGYTEFLSIFQSTVAAYKL